VNAILICYCSFQISELRYFRRIRSRFNGKEVSRMSTKMFKSCQQDGRHKTSKTTPWLSDLRQPLKTLIDRQVIYWP